MAIIGQIVLVSGLLIAAGGSVWLIILAFQENPLWGLACLFLPFVSLVFAIMFWSQAKKPFLISIGGLVLSIVGIMVIGNRLGDIH